MVIFSKKLNEVVLGKSKLQLKYDDEDEYFGVPFYYHGVCVILIGFDPWTGDLLEGSFKERMGGMHNIEEPIRYDIMKNLIYDIAQKHRTKLCNSLSYYVDDGKDSGMTSIIHIPNIRTYAILNKREFGGFEPMDYCPFCGAKFPKRLDEKLTEILQSEYGFDSWKDYKKAPKEFHTNEWWKKRGF